jgi:two-component system NtrC family sensor kinase
MITARMETLKKRLARTVIAYAVLPAALLAACLCGYALHMVDREHRDVSADELRMLSAAWTSLVEREFRTAELALEAIADTAGAEIPEAALARTFNSIRRNIPWIDGASVLTADGTPIARAGMPPAVQAAELGAAAQTGGSSLIVTDVASGPDGLPRFRMLLPPAPGAGTIACVSVNAVVFSSLLDRTRIGRTGEVFLVDQAGMLRTASVLHGPLQGRADDALMRPPSQNAGILTRDWQGTRLWYSTRPVDATPGWRLVVQRDEREILQSRDAALLRVAALGLGGLALLTALAFMAVRQVQGLQERMDAEYAGVLEHEMQIRKLDAISQLGVGIAHEVNNPLAIIGEEAGWMQDLLRRESFRDNPDAGELQDSLRQIVMQTARSREITHKLLSFGGKTDGTIRDTDLNTLVGDVAMLRRREASTKDIEILEEPAGKLPVILSEPALLRQLLTNILTNCMDAMPHGGVITISTTAAEGGGVRLSVRDTGFGIPQENLPRIFDPFFTTKPPGKGAGLGLSICHGIMQRLGGRIFAESVPGTGTTITVELPLEACARTS